MGKASLRASLAVAAATVVLVAAPPGRAVYHGGNGTIAYDRFVSGVPGTEVWVVNPDGSDQAKLADGDSPSWSSDGARLAYGCAEPNPDSVCTANADGSSVDVVPTSEDVSPQDDPTWSPDGKTIAVASGGSCGRFCFFSDIWRVDVADGGDPIQLISNGNQPSWSRNRRVVYTFVQCGFGCSPSEIRVVSAIAPGNYGQLTMGDNSGSPDWSPDGEKVVFVGGDLDVYTMNADGTGQANVTNSAESEVASAWSPDGTKIVYSRYENGQYDLFLMNPDGSGQTNITNTPGVSEHAPAWQPVPQSYIRPAGATPVRVSLVPAFERCTDANREHGSPLDHPSCAPPQHRTGYMTLGSKSVGWARLRARPGTPDPGNQADVQIEARITDARRVFDLADGLGGLELRVPVTLTDMFNGAYNSEPATMQEFTVSALMPCTDTPEDTTIGSTCAVTTTANALIPPTYPLPSSDFVNEGNRAIWQVGQVSIWEPGDDGHIESTDDNTVFAVQGVFVP